MAMPMTSKKFLKQDEEDVRDEELFAYKFFKNKALKTKKKKKKDGDESDSEEEEGDSDEDGDDFDMDGGDDDIEDMSDGEIDAVLDEAIGVDKGGVGFDVDEDDDSDLQFSMSDSDDDDDDGDDADGIEDDDEVGGRYVDCIYLAFILSLRRRSGFS
tara:strand:+ start:270 stop:740 length:471 start_codon:yes stop_codon:yes gene_type:complete